jgi:hypothetical protein
MKLNPLFLLLTIVLLSSCGVITKARYGNGLKFNLETRLFSKHTNTDQSKKTTFKSKRKPTLTNEKKDSVIYIADEFNMDEPETNALQNISESPISNKPLFENTPNKTSLTSKIHDFRKEISVKKLFNPIIKKQVRNDGYRPLERNAKWAGIIFYGSILLRFLLINVTPSVFINMFAIFNLIGLITFILLTIGFGLAIKSLKLQRENNFSFSSKILATSIVVLGAIFILLILMFNLLILSIIL